MILRSCNVNLTRPVLDVTTHDDLYQRFAAAGPVGAEAEMSFVLTSPEDLANIQAYFHELKNADMVTVRKRLRRGLRCAYCGGNPGHYRSCEGCGAPNWSER